MYIYIYKQREMGETISFSLASWPKLEANQTKSSAGLYLGDNEKNYACADDGESHE
jgi:hypothetical protein